MGMEAGKNVLGAREVEDLIRDYSRSLRAPDGLSTK